MIELIYPMDIAPLVPSRYVYDTVNQSLMTERDHEMFPVVAPTGEVSARAERWYCHSGAKVLHPVVHLHIIDRYKGLCLQKRSMSKDIQPGRWDTAVGGHVDYGESIGEALFRECSEEIGLTRFNPFYIKSYVWESEKEKELVNVFAAVGSFNLKPDFDEVDEIRYWDFDLIDSELGTERFTPQFEQEYAQIREQLVALL